MPDGSAIARAIDYSLKRAGRRSRASSTMANCRSTTTGWRTASGRSRWVGNELAVRRGVCVRARAAAVMSPVPFGHAGNGQMTCTAISKTCWRRLPTASHRAGSGVLPHRWRPLRRRQPEHPPAASNWNRRARTEPVRRARSSHRPLGAGRVLQCRTREELVALMGICSFLMADRTGAGQRRLQPSKCAASVMAGAPSPGILRSVVALTGTRRSAVMSLSAASNATVAVFFGEVDSDQSPSDLLRGLLDRDRARPAAQNKHRRRS